MSCQGRSDKGFKGPNAINLKEKDTQHKQPQTFGLHGFYGFFAFTFRLNLHIRAIRG